jgi:hypothetical protein
MSAHIETSAFSGRVHLKELRVQHRDIDSEIIQLGHKLVADQLKIKRLKKRKLLIKDMINKLESELIPNLNA